MDDFLFWWEHFLLRKDKKNWTIIWTKHFFGPNLCQAKSGIISFLVVMIGGGGGGGEGVTSAKIKVAQNDLNHILLLKIFRSDEIFEIS